MFYFRFFLDLILFLSEVFQFYVIKSVCASLLIDETDFIGTKLRFVIHQIYLKAGRCLKKLQCHKYYTGKKAWHLSGRQLLSNQVSRFFAIIVYYVIIRWGVGVKWVLNHVMKYPIFLTASLSWILLPFCIYVVIISLPISLKLT